MHHFLRAIVCHFAVFTWRPTLYEEPAKLAPDAVIDFDGRRSARAAEAIAPEDL